MSDTLLLEITTIKSENTALRNRVESLERILAALKRDKFGKKSERILDDGNKQRDLLSFLEDRPKVFNEAEVTATKESDKEEIEVKPYKRKVKKKTLLSELPVDEVVIVDLPESEKVCPTHGIPLQKVGETIVIKLEVQPAERRIIKQVTLVYGPCSDFCAEPKKNQDAFDILPSTAATPSLLADLISYKYLYALPFYRIESLWARVGIEITRATMARWVIVAAEKTSALINLMTEDLMSQGYFQCDETPVNVLNVNGTRKESKSYMWVRYAPVVPIVIYEFHPTRSGSVPTGFLEGYSGYMQVDGYSGYNVIKNFKDVIELACWVHARRYFHTAYVDDKSKLARDLLKIIKRLFLVDEEAAKLKLSYNDRKKLRDENSKPIIKEIEDWLKEYKPQVRPNSALGVAINYTLNNWQELNVFLEDGRLELSTNWVENKIRPFTIGRKNWLFFETDNGANAGCLFYSLIESAKANGLDPKKYLEHVFKELPKSKTLADLEKLLPYDRSALKTRLNVD